MKKGLNQKLINLIEYYNLNNANILFSKKPVKRINTKNTTSSFSGNKNQKLKKSKDNAQNFVMQIREKSKNLFATEKDFKKLITHVLDFEDVNLGIEKVRKGDTGRVILKFKNS